MTFILPEGAEETASNFMQRFIQEEIDLRLKEELRREIVKEVRLSLGEFLNLKLIKEGLILWLLSLALIFFIGRIGL